MDGTKTRRTEIDLVPLSIDRQERNLAVLLDVNSPQSARCYVWKRDVEFKIQNSNEREIMPGVLMFPVNNKLHRVEMKMNK